MVVVGGFDLDLGVVGAGILSCGALAHAEEWRHDWTRPD